MFNGGGRKRGQDTNLPIEKFSLVRPIVRGVEPSPRSCIITIELEAHRTPFSATFLVLGGWCRGECNEVVLDKYFMDAYTLRVEMDESLLALGTQSITLDWTNCPISGQSPANRVGYSANLCKDSIIIFGGGRLWTDGVVYNDLWTIDMTTMAWRKLNPQGTPPRPRQGHVSISLPGGVDIAILGGTDNAGVEHLEDVHILHCPRVTSRAGSYRWSTPQLGAARCCPYSYMSAVAVEGQDGGSVLLFGGSCWNDHAAYVSNESYRYVESFFWSIPAPSCNLRA